MRVPAPGAWCVLRCAGQNTLRLAQSLAWANIEAWSPAVTVVQRDGDNRTRRQLRLPLLPNYVFVRAVHLHDLLTIHEDPMSPHPSFSFIYDLAGKVSHCPDRHLDPLRLAEQKGRPVEQGRKWGKGDRVIYPGSGFEGLIGTVERVTKGTAWVDFGLFGKPSKVPSAMLLAHNEQAYRQVA